MTRELRADPKDYRTVLNLPGAAGDIQSSQLTKAFRQQSLLVHPDKNAAPNAEEGFKKLQAAYASLKEEMGRARSASTAPPQYYPPPPPPRSEANAGGSTGGSAYGAYSSGGTYGGGFPSGSGFGGASSASSHAGGQSHTSGGGRAAGATGTGDGPYAWTGSRGPAGSSSYGASWARSAQDVNAPPWGTDRATRDQFNKWSHVPGHKRQPSGGAPGHRRQPSGSSR